MTCCSCLVGDDTRSSFIISGTEVVIEASRVSSSMQPLHYSRHVVACFCFQFLFNHPSLLFLGRIAVLHTYMRPILTDQVAWSVGLSVTLVSPAKMAALIELPFGLRTWVGPGNHVLDGGLDPPWEGANFGGEWASHCKV